MTIQPQRQQTKRSQGFGLRRIHIPWRRLIIFTVAFILIASGASIWIAQSTSHEFWPNTLSIIFVACGIMVGLLQWLFPFSSNNPAANVSQTQPPPRQPHSNPVAAHSHATMSAKHYPYDVALSYAGEDRGKAETLVAALQRCGVKVFYDQNEKSTICGKNLYIYLSDLYKNKARYCLMLL